MFTESTSELVSLSVLIICGCITSHSDLSTPTDSGRFISQFPWVQSLRDNDPRVSAQCLQLWSPDSSKCFIIFGLLITKLKKE